MRAMLTSLLVVLGIGAALYTTLCAFLYVQQDRILFYPGPNDSTLIREWQSRRIQIVSAGHTLEGWWAENPRSTSPLVLIYFGGNAEDVLVTATTAHRFDVRRVLVVNYRGYGQTQGRPSQSALYEDGLAIYDYVAREGARPEHIVVMGRSLGSGVATMLAAKRRVNRAILVTPFDSIAAVAAEHYPFFPVRLLLRHPFDSVPFARQAAVPALILAAEQDTIIPPRRAQRLHELWGGPKHFRLLRGVGHNDIEASPDYLSSINAFLREH
jgi:uncharacterized protein